MSNTNSNSSDNKQVWYKSPWLIAWLLLVTIVITVNAYMIFQSINDFPGLVVDDFYDRGKDYEENIHKKLANNENWKTTFKIAKIHPDKPAVINVIIKDKAGVVMNSVEKMTLFVYRPSDAKKDFSVPMVLAENKQSYQSTVTFSKGKWDLLASAVIDGVEVNYAKSILVKE